MLGQITPTPVSSQLYFSVKTNQPPTTSQLHFSLRTNQPQATVQQYFFPEQIKHQPLAKRTDCKLLIYNSK
jgi:hypothetical protein